MWRSALAACVVAAGPAAAAGLEITVAGEGANGTITIDLLEDVAPAHVTQITALAAAGAYDGVVFHRVIDGFMAQTGDVQFGDSTSETYDYRYAGRGASDLPDVPAEFSDISFEKGIVGMARSESVDSANSQFFIMFATKDFLDNKYTVVGRVTSGQDVVDTIKRGHPRTGAMTTGEPDRMVKVVVTE